MRTLLLTTALILVAAAGTYAKEPAGKPDQPRTAEKLPPPLTDLKGTVKDLDQTQRRITITDASGKSREMKIAEDAVIKKGQETVKLSEIKEGQRVSVRYSDKNGQQTVDRILIQSQEER